MAGQGLRGQYSLCGRIASNWLSKVWIQESTGGPNGQSASRGQGLKLGMYGMKGVRMFRNPTGGVFRSESGGQSRPATRGKQVLTSCPPPVIQGDRVLNGFSLEPLIPSWTSRFLLAHRV
ncbi:hypothetical protein VTO42DRAFT_3907 [Malbranchea cinnamomea]